MNRAERHSQLVPAPRISEMEVMKACNVLHAQQLAIYQRLYKVGLTQPGFPARPFGVRRSIEHLGCIEIVSGGPKEYKFLMSPREDPDLVIARAEELFDAIKSGKSSVDPRACCPVAELTPCVCVVSFKCTIHGRHCIGSHD